MPLLKVGDRAPDFAVKSHSGQDISLSDYLGKTVVLWFYPKADTPGCTTEGCGFRDRIAVYDSKNVQILGISFDTVEENAAFAAKFNFPYPLLCDTTRTVGLKYGACDSADAEYPKRITYVIDPNGNIGQVHGKVNVTLHPDEVLHTL